VHGMFLEKALQGTIKKSGGKIVIFNTSLDIERTETKGTLLFENAEDMLNFSKDEEKRMLCLVDSISENVNAVICNGNINEQYAEFFNNNNVMVIKVNSKFDIRRIMRMSKGSLLQTVRRPRREETGEIDSITTVYDEGKTYLRLEKKDSNIVSIVLKDSLASNLDESELLLEKGIKIMESLRDEDLYFVNGGGVFEKQLSDRLAEKSTNIRDSSKLVYSAVVKALSYFCPPDDVDTEQLKDIYSVKQRALEYAFDLACEVLMIEDYLVAKNEGPEANN
ncbi:Chaperonin complex component, TCP-1 theta subunit (CCT8), partial [Trachipleistophora hominis]